MPEIKPEPSRPDAQVDERVARWRYVQAERAKVPPTPLRTIAKALGVSAERVRQLAAMEAPGLPGWAGHSARNGGEPPSD